MLLDDAIAVGWARSVSLDPALEREFEERVADSSTLAFRVALGVLRHREDAEDVAQDAFLRAHRAFASLRDRDRFRAWLVRTAFRLALDRLRGEKRRARREDAVGDRGAGPDGVGRGRGGAGGGAGAGGGGGRRAAREAADRDGAGGDPGARRGVGRAAPGAAGGDGEVPAVPGAQGAGGEAAMACERYREALRTWRRACRPRPASRRTSPRARRAGRSSQALRRALAVADAEMAGLLAAEPTPELAARIRAGGGGAGAFAALALRLAVAGDGRGGHAARGARGRAGARHSAGTGAPRGRGRAPAATAGSTRATEPAWPEPRRGRPRPVSRRSPGALIPRSAGQPERRGSAVTASRATRRPAVARDDRPPEPEVLVPPGEAEALLRFAALVHRDRLAPDSLLVGASSSADLAGAERRRHPAARDRPAGPGRDLRDR